MGTWGTGLYADDFALDLRGSITGIARLPVSGDDIFALLRAEAGDSAGNPSNDEYSRFWLVVADQFQKRGILCPEVTRKAFDIIDTGADVRTFAALGMAEDELRKRASVLGVLPIRLSADTAPRSRNTLKKPQQLIMQPGEVLVYPTSGGEPYNPYVTSAMQERYETAYKWKADGWGAMAILKAKVGYGYLAWYAPLVVRKEIAAKPRLDSLQNQPWTRQSPGTCPPSHFKRLALEQIGTLPIREEFETTFSAPTMKVLARRCKMFPSQIA